jgi:phospholipase C
MTRSARAAFVVGLAFWLPLTLQGSSSAQTGRDALLADLRAHVKHVFVIYQENRSFDSYFGTFPGAENLGTALAREHGFRQFDPLGGGWIAPFRIVDPDVADADHSRPSLYTKVDGGRMDLFVADEEFRWLHLGASRENARRMGLLTMAYEDCDTIPFLWKYAREFALYDHFFQGMYAPSTPGNIDLIAAQTGQTMAARNPKDTVAPSDVGPGEPVVNDTYPAFGPYHNGEPKVKQLDQTYANILLTLTGKDAQADVKNDAGEIKDDIAYLASRSSPSIGWGWYQEGFKDDGSGKYPAYVTHHNAPQYFGYVRQNQPLWGGIHDLTELYPALENGTLPDRGVFFVKGGYINPFGWKPANPDPKVQKEFVGDDDHPGYSDSQLAESLVAKTVNAIARSTYWRDSAIIVTWDDSEGFYDHVPPPQFEPCPDKRPCGDGPRVPFILISPYAKSGAIVSDPGDHASFAKFVETLFGIPALASLPDEKPYLPQGPRDENPALTDLLGGFDPQRLAGTKAPIPASLAEIPDAIVESFPPRMSCRSLGITPIVPPGGMASPPPGFGPRMR